MYIFEADMVNPIVRRLSPNQRHGSEVPSPVYAMRYTTVVTGCMKAAKGFFDAFLTIPVSEYPFLAAHQWFSLVYATVMLYKLSLGLYRLPSWDVSITQSFAPLEEYIDKLCKNMIVARRSSCPDDTVLGKDLYSLQDIIWKDVSKEYIRRRGSAHDKRLASSSTAVHRVILGRESGQGRGLEPTSEIGEKLIDKNRSAHPCPAHIYWKD
jgi:hypothetical protein